VVAPARAARPGAPVAGVTDPVCSRDQEAFCPFCAGREEQTPATLFRVGDPWRVRIVANRYPPLTPPDGRCEVCVHTPLHTLRLATLSDQQLGLVVSAWAARAAVYAADGYPAVVVGVNEGRAAGATLDHTHSQLLGLRAAPPRLETELAGGGPRLDGLVVAQSGGVVVFVPAACRAAFELRAAPDDASPDAWRDTSRLAEALRVAVRLADAALGPVAFNIWLHTRPAGDDRAFRWHLELVPRIGVAAAFELGAGLYITSTPPEDAAERYVGALRAIRMRGSVDANGCECGSP
jgi:UDPglucose--hexose-1-phosphate uridylyltransferase